MSWINESPCLNADTVNIYINTTGSEFVKGQYQTTVMGDGKVVINTTNKPTAQPSITPKTTAVQPTEKQTTANITKCIYDLSEAIKRMRALDERTSKMIADKLAQCKQYNAQIPANVTI
ncbi:hypothetical protein EIN_391530 [Entamoeba invadens IP1]|uniref:Uncharacterized protein n=1 Tax=Entamoeba invadens IP1 TaxID=370355 RepID=A0A0A1U8T1_ENTIV|nr:hypothetical protein EIN_391530 [Entamoeba invadens IP1]ELP89498.1 hypothetical protein EIN_391530 [Entamoeba invadens IP1]|eukprot:XP_004256269.1 hypothetical protein EIN_391530 [Entamoeba invadens IP1]